MQPGYGMKNLPPDKRPFRVLLVNQAFYPDHVATAQYLTDLARELTRMGCQVTAVAGSRAYDNPSRRFPVREEWEGVRIRRIWTPGLGKGAKWKRLVDFGTFWISAIWTLAWLPRHDVTISLTSPPLISTLATLFSVLKGGQSLPWIMDLNPDEAVAAGWLRQGSLAERFMSAAQNWSFGRAAGIVVLDRFMADRVAAKGVPAEKIHTIPPWSQGQAQTHDAAGREAFRRTHGLQDKFVIMYAGNHSPCHPLDTVLDAADQLRSREDIHFLFVGGGSEFAKVQAFAKEKALTSITCLPYQPREQLSASLSSADLHLVVMGDAFLGMVHPCKIYNIAALGVPFLFVGPTPSHVSDLIAAMSPPPGYARVARHGDSVAVRRHMEEAAALRLPPLREPSPALAAFAEETLLPKLATLALSASK